MDPERPRCEAEPAMPASGLSWPMYKPGLPGTRCIWRLSVTSQTALPASEGKAGFTFSFGDEATIGERPGSVDVPIRLGRLVWLLARQGRLARLRPGSVPLRPGSVPLSAEPFTPSWPTPGRVPLDPDAGAQADGL